MLGLMPGVKEVDVDFTFDPPWSPEKMTDEARADLGLD
jgi:metal-sulfur cluster biosynthetic enzyme